MAEFLGCATVAFPFFALVALLFGYRDEALELCVLGAVALGLALVQRWWRWWTGWGDNNDLSRL